MTRRAVKLSRKPVAYTGIRLYSPRVTRELFERLLPYVGWPGVTPVLTALAINQPVQPDSLESALQGLNKAIMARVNAEETASDVAELMFLQRALLGLVSPFSPYVGEANPIASLNADERRRIAADLTDYMLGVSSSRLQQRVKYQKFRPALAALLAEYIENPATEPAIDEPELLYSKTSRVTGDTVRIVHEVDGTYSVEYITGDRMYLKERQTLPAACQHYLVVASLLV
jgi:hypothetical protein